MSKLPLIIVASAALSSARHQRRTLQHSQHSHSPGRVRLRDLRTAQGLAPARLFSELYAGDSITNSNFESFTYHSNVMSL